MWGKRRTKELREKHTLTTDTVPNDIHEARAIRDENQKDLRQVKAQAPFVLRLTDGLRARGPQNHYIELLHMKAREN